MSLFILVFSSFVSSLYSYNYQTVEHWRYLRQEQPTYQPSKTPSYFGYSLAVHRSRYAERTDDSVQIRFISFSLLIGAPRDHSPYDIVTRRGAVWRCEFQSDGQCQRLPFRRDGKDLSRAFCSLNVLFQVKRMSALALHSIIKQING